MISFYNPRVYYSHVFNTDLDNLYMQGELKSNSKFVTKTKIRRKEQFAGKNAGGSSSGNQFVEIEPAVIEFPGFQIGKLYTATLRIINKAGVGQRVTVLPLQSSAFTFRMDKKGEIPTGMAEVVHIDFIPGEQKYFSDYLRINTQSQNFQVPIHAYPILMPREQLARIIPKIVDFGTLNVGEMETNVYVIPSSVPISFEFEFVYKKECPEISIEPMKGVIEGYSSLEVRITFNALKKITSSAEVYLNINQYGFDPLLISILGTGRQKELKPVRPKSSKNEQEMNSSINSNLNKNKPLLQSRRLSLKPSVKQQPQKEAKQGSELKQSVKDFTKSLAPSLPRRPQSARKYTSTLNAKVSLLQTLQQTSNVEQTQKRKKQKEFLEHFNEVFNNDKQKQIKFAVYFGDTPLTEAQIQEIKEQRIDQKYQFLKEVESSSVNRHIISENKSLVAVDYHRCERIVPTFSAARNDVLKKRQKVLERFNVAASKVLIVNRMVKKLRKIQEWARTEKDSPKSSETMTTKHSSRINNILGQTQFRMSQNKFTLESFKLQFQGSGTNSQELFEVKATTEFDDSAPLELLEGFEPQMMGYDQLPYPLSYINPLVKPPSARQGAQEQNPTRGAAVPIPEIPQKLNVYSLPPKLPFYQYILEHPTIKFVQKANPNSQNSLNYLFQNTSRIDDQYDGWSEGDRDVLRYKFMKGMDVPHLTISGRVGTDDIYDVGFLRDIHQYCPKHLSSPQPDDPFSDQDSDNQEYPSLPVAKKEQFQKKIEGDNKRLQAKRERVENQLQESLRAIDQNLNANKIRALSLVPSTLNDFNKKVDKEEKLIII